MVQVLRQWLSSNGKAKIPVVVWYMSVRVFAVPVWCWSAQDERRLYIGNLTWIVMPVKELLSSRLDGLPADMRASRQ